MDVAIVTGASSTLGLAISRRLIDLGFRVYGLGGNFADIPLRNSAFVPVNCNLADPGQVEGGAREIIAKERAVCLVVNNAKLYPPEDLTRATTDQLERSLAVNLLCPLVLLREALPGLQRLQGQIVNIASATPETGRGGPAGAATAGALRWMGEQLFQQLRETGVKVTTISPEPNRWRPADTTPAPGQRPQSVIDPDAVAGCVADLVSNRSGNVITEIVLRPQRIVEKPQVPVRELPYPKPQPIPYTVPRAEIEAEEQLDDEREIAQERREGRGQPDAQGKEGARRGRRRSRGRRGKGEREEPREKPAAQPQRASSAPEPGEAGDAATAPRKPEPQTNDAGPPEPPRQGGVEEAAASGNRRKRRRKPRPSAMGINVDQPPFASAGGPSAPKAVGTGSGGAPSSGPAEAAAVSGAGAKPVVADPSAGVEAPPDGRATESATLPRRTPVGEEATSHKPPRKAAKKATVKKAAKKAAGQSTAKKSAKKKTVVKKTTAKKAATKKAPRKTVKKKAEQA